MTNKKRLHHIWTKLRPISPWYFLALAIVSGIISIYAIRQNNLTMISLRDEVFMTDQQDGDTETALRNLRGYVYAHMNTNLSSGNNSVKPPVQLKYRYNRLVQAEKDLVSSGNAQIYTQAQTVCEKLVPQGISGSGRISCIQEYVSQHGVKEQAIPDSLYKFDFVSPLWTPDVAGWSLLISVLGVVLFIVSYGLDRWIKSELHDHL